MDLDAVPVRLGRELGDRLQLLQGQFLRSDRRRIERFGGDFLDLRRTLRFRDKRFRPVGLPRLRFLGVARLDRRTVGLRRQQSFRVLERRLVVGAGRNWPAMVQLAVTQTATHNQGEYPGAEQ